MYPLIKKINIDLIKEIYHYNNYSKLDLEYFEYLHRDKMIDVLIELDHFFLRPKLINLLTLQLCRDRYRYPTRIALNR